jgi:hypothetical protein
VFTNLANLVVAEFLVQNHLEGCLKLRLWLSSSRTRLNIFVSNSGCSDDAVMMECEVYFLRTNRKDYILVHEAGSADIVSELCLQCKDTIGLHSLNSMLVSDMSQA